jgi:tetratricopeptide (TPR) repeat protein/transglutaminase-like putative cysteine protease
MNPRFRLGLACLFLLAGQIARAAGPFDEELAERHQALTRLAGKPEAVTALVDVLDLWDLVDDRARLVALLDEARGDARQHPAVRARATFLRAAVHDRQGERARGDELRRELGVIGAWMVLGPFDNEGKAGHAQVLPPESEPVVDPGREYAGRERPVRWRVFPERLASRGLVALDAGLRPAENVVGYATTWVEVARDQDVALHTGSTGAIKVWVNGREVLSREVYRPVRFDQDVAGARLRAGWNRILVKVCAAEAGWTFFLRLSTPDGRPLRLLGEGASLGQGQGQGQAQAQVMFRVSSTPHPVAVAAAVERGRRRQAPVRVPVPVVDLEAELRRAAKGGDAMALRALGLYLMEVSPEDVEVQAAYQELERSAALSSTTEGYRLAARAARNHDDRRKALELALDATRAQKATPRERARALTELARVYAEARRERRAMDLLHQALAADPDYFPATLALGQLAADGGLPAAGQALIEEVARRHGALAVLRAQAELIVQRDQDALAEPLYRRLHEANQEDLSALRALYRLARNRGDIPVALGFLDELTRARPELSSPVSEREELLVGLGRFDEARALLVQAIADCPEEARLHERLGCVLHRLGREAEALGELRRALELRPQNPDLRAYVRHLETAEARAPSAVGAAGAAGASGASGSSGRGDKAEKRKDDLARAWEVPIAEVLEAGRKSPAPKDGGDAARVLLDLEATRVHPNGLSETFTERVVEILDERGAREQNEVDIRYTPDTQSVEVKWARIYKKSGQVVQAVAQFDRDVSEPWYGLYYDVRAQSIEFSRLEPGDVVAVAYVVSDVGRRNLLADYFGDLHALQEDLPRLDSRYVLITPRSRTFYFNEPRLPRLVREVREQGDERIFMYRAEGVPKVAAEPGMPGFTEVAAYVHVSTYKSWEDVATWYRGLVAEQLVPDDALRHLAAEAVRGVTDERVRIRRIYDLVVQKTRYVGLEFGIHGYKPYRVTQVYARKFGDCKDKASLLLVLLREIGVEATLVLARTRRGGNLDPYPASLAPFDHAIVYVPKHDLYLDGTAEFSGSGELPAQDQDIPVLLVSDPRAGGRGHLVRTPVLPAERNRVVRSSRVELQAPGSARVVLDASVSGEAAHEWREHYQTPGERSERFEKAENMSHPGARVLRVEFPSLDDLERPVEVRAELEVPWARRRGGDLEMLALGHEGQLARAYARLSERAHDLVLGFPWEQEEQVTYVLPMGYGPKRLPEPRRIESPFGRFVLAVERTGREVQVRSALTVLRHRVTRAEYPAFRRFCLEVDRAMEQALVLGGEEAKNEAR